MAKIKRVPRCYKCGVILQSDDLNKKGYCSPSLLGDPQVVKEQVLYCQDCYEAMKDINSGELNQSIDDETLKILDDAVASDALIAWVIDLTTFNGTLNRNVVQKIRNLRFSVLGTKKDLLPLNTKESDVIDFIRTNFEENGIKPGYIKLIDGNNPADYEEAFNAGLNYRKGHDIYVIGDTGSGKTTIINYCLRFFVNKTQKAVRAIEYPKTNIIVTELPLSRSSSLYCLPGLSLDTSVLGKVEKRVVKQISVHKRMKQTNISLLKGQCVAIGSLGAYCLVDGKPTQFKLFSSESVMTKKMNENAFNSFLAENVATRAVKPVSNNFVSFTDFDVFEYQMDNDNKHHDISIQGLCWLSFVAKGQKIRVYAPKGCAIKESISKIK